MQMTNIIGRTENYIKGTFLGGKKLKNGNKR